MTDDPGNSLSIEHMRTSFTFLCCCFCCFLVTFESFTASASLPTTSPKEKVSTTSSFIPLIHSRSTSSQQSQTLLRAPAQSASLSTPQLPKYYEELAGLGVKNDGGNLPRGVLKSFSSNFKRPATSSIPKRVTFSPETKAPPAIVASSDADFHFYPKVKSVQARSEINFKPRIYEQKTEQPAGLPAVLKSNRASGYSSAHNPIFNARKKLK